MKRLITLFLLTTATVFAQAPRTAVFSWSYVYDSNYTGACSDTVKTDCIQNFVLSNGTNVVATIPATSSTSYSYTLSTLPAPGTYNYTLNAIGVYQGGKTIQSIPVMVSLQVPQQPSAPTNFTVVLQ